MTDQEGQPREARLERARRRYTRREMLRFGALGAGVIGTAPLLGATGSSATTRSAAARRVSPKRGGTLNFGRDTGPTQLDPANSIVAGDVYTLDKIFEPLYITSPSGVLTPWLAQGHTMSSDGKTWTFALRPGVKFSDGKPVTADRRRVFDPPRRHRRDRAAQLLGLRDQVDQGRLAPAPVTFELSQPWAPFLSDISVFANCDPARPNFGGESESAFFASPVGTGPFTLKSFQRAPASSSRGTRTTGSQASPTSTRSTSATSPTTTSASSSSRGARST